MRSTEDCDSSPECSISISIFASSAVHIYVAPRENHRGQIRIQCQVVAHGYMVCIRPIQHSLRIGLYFLNLGKTNRELQVSAHVCQ